MTDPILVRLKTPMRGAPQDALLPAETAHRLLAGGEAENPRDRFGVPLAAEPEPAPKSAYKTRAMRAK